MNKLVLGFLMGVALVLMANYGLEELVHDQAKTEILANDRHWENILKRELARQKAAHLDWIRLEQQKWERGLETEKLRAYRNGENAGRKNCLDHYEKRLSRQSADFFTALERIRRESDSFQLLANSTSRQLLQVQMQSDSLSEVAERLTAQLKARNEEITSTSIEVANSKPTVLLLTGYFSGSVILLVIITLLIMRFRQRRRHQRFRL